MKVPLLLIILFSSFFLLMSCTTSSTHNRGSLNAAMDKSRDENEEDREVPDEEDPWWVDEEDDSSEAQQKGPDAQQADTSMMLPTEPMSLNVLIRGESGLRGGPYFTSDFSGEILLGDGKDHWEAYLFAGFDNLRVKPTHSVSESVKDNAFTLYAGVEGRYYVFPELRVFSPYILARMGGVLLFWEFQNPLTSGGDTIASDILGGLLLGCGAGIDLYHGEDFRVGLTLIPDAYLFGEETQQGFTNDYFNSQGFVRWGMEAGARF